MDGAEAVAALALRALAGTEPEQLVDEALASISEQLPGTEAALEELEPGEEPVESHTDSELSVVVRGGDEPFGMLRVTGPNLGELGETELAFVGAVARVLGAAVERQRVEQVLAESEGLFRELADHAPVMIWTTDRDGLVTFVNRGWLDFTGTTLEDELGESWTLGVHPDDVRRMLDVWNDALAMREPYSMEYRLRRKDGEFRWIVDRGVPRRSEKGEFTGYVGTASDIHERKQMEEALRRVYEREHRVAETLQRSLLPEKLPEIEGVSLAARYLPAGEGAAVGGDWYDAAELPDGRVALVVGDVVGHGLRAAAVMGQLRNAFRAYAITDTSPAEILARMNRLAMTAGEGVMATVLYLAFDRDTGDVSFASAGHPPALLLTPDGPRYLEGGRSVPVGAAELATFREENATIPAGSTLLLYTDGLVERRDTPLDDRFGHLAAAAAASGGDLEDLCDEILEGVLGGTEPPDDVALLAVRPAPIDANRLDLSLPAEPEQLARLRRRLARFLHAAGANEEETYEITLTISEAAGNAIEHAYGPGDASFRVQAVVEDGELVVVVRDSGSWRERRGEHRGRGLSIIEGLMEAVEIVREAHGTTVRMRRRLTARVPA